MDKEIKVYRFKVPIIKRGDIHKIEFRSNGPIPIVATDGRILGFGVLEDKPTAAVVSCAIDPSTPERFDLETHSHLYWMDAVLEYRGFLNGASVGLSPSIAIIKTLIMTNERVAGQEPIDPKIAVLE